MDRRRRPYLLLNDASLVESMICLMRTDGARRPGIARHGPAERACTLGVTRQLKRKDSRSSYQRKEKKHGKARAMTMLARKIARAVYQMLKRKEAFDAVKFFAN